jgi:hypothetical protein
MEQIMEANLEEDGVPIIPEVCKKCSEICCIMKKAGDSSKLRFDIGDKIIEIDLKGKIEISGCPYRLEHIVSRDTNTITIEEK